MLLHRVMYSPCQTRLLHGTLCTCIKYNTEDSKYKLNTTRNITEINKNIKNMQHIKKDSMYSFLRVWDSISTMQVILHLQQQILLIKISINFDLLSCNTNYFFFDKKKLNIKCGKRLNKNLILEHFYKKNPLRN